MVKITPIPPLLALAFRSSPLYTPGPGRVEISKAIRARTDADSTISFLPLKESAQLGRALFLASSSRLSATLGNIHPQLRRGEIYDSTEDGWNSLIRRLQLGIPKVSEHLITTRNLEGSVIIVGGPVANLHSRLILGCGDVSPLLGVKLPIRFDFGSRLEHAKNSGTEPWRVVVDGRASESECLVITSLPMGNEDRAVVVAGLHGAGTRAIDLLLTSENQGLLDRLHRDTKDFAGWQAICRVFARDSETPAALDDFDVRIFEIKNVDLDRVRASIGDELFLNVSRIKQLINVLPFAAKDPIFQMRRILAW